MSIKVPDDLPPLAHLTSPEHPWPLRLLSAKIGEYVAKMSRLWVEGEVIALKRRANARVQFFTLADLEEKMTITCKIWSHNLPSTISEGSRVIIAAKPDFWTGNGSLSLQTDEIRMVGVGDLLARIEQLKARLGAEGLFDPAKKKPLPFLPRKIGLICGRNTQAMHDVVENVQRRWAAAQFEIREVQVQGAGAVEAMIPALQELDAIDDVDVIVLARGGGSVEDLFPFSDERLVRAAFAATTPIVSAIGHEPDSPVLDFVADFRASTPTDAAKNIVPDVGEERVGLTTTVRRGRIAVDHLLDLAMGELATLRARPALAQPEAMVDNRAEDLADLREWSNTHIRRILDSHRSALDTELGRLRTLSPLSTLKRGYAVIRTEDGLVGSVDGVTTGAKARATLHDGTLDMTINRVTKG
ncbi:MAG: exodeoxyribonuclease VII large subunit [Trueperella sp.]|uniref:exodeoxyribonuclease VII large subunit n=1 Tax=Trueperella sp. TaxID=2699835 RepID=UPI0025D3C40B|nr:exodeoxyribonuclease VII large subunit [Trueperella sp.]MCI7305985.1 exodeoxyribonuclease VII large subunit [Trueperella sp.]MDY5404612.1 exodeoxyribonuclease VII large subunit [Trueperella sp.]